MNQPIYTFSLSHHASQSDRSPVKAINLNDDIAGAGIYVGGDNGNAELDWAETWIYTATYTPLPEDISPLLNTVIATALTQNNKPLLISATHSTNLIYQPVLQFVLDGANISPVNQLTGYTFTLQHHPQNSDNSPINTLVVTDTLGTQINLISNGDGDDLLEAGENWIYTAQYLIQPANATPLGNTGFASGYNSNGDLVQAIDSHTTTISYESTLNLLLDALSVGQVGDEITYYIRVLNAGLIANPLPFQNLNVTSTPAQSITYIAGDKNTNNLLDKGEIWVYTMQATIALTDAMAIRTDVTVLAEEQGTGQTVHATATHTLQIDYQPALNITQTGPEVGVAGNQMWFNFSITNDITKGDGSPIRNLVLTDTTGYVPTRIRTLNDNGNDVLDGGEIWVYETFYIVPPNQTNPYLNIGVASGFDKNDDLIQNTAIHTVIIGQESGLTLEITGPETGLVGDNVVLTYTVSNTTSNGAYSAVKNIYFDEVTAAKLNPVTGDINNDQILGIGEVWVYTASHIISLNNTDPLIENASILGNDSSNNIIGSTALHYIDIDYRPALGISILNQLRNEGVGAKILQVSIINDPVTGDGSAMTELYVQDTFLGELTLIEGDNGNNLLEVGEIWLYESRDLQIDVSQVSTLTVTARDLDSEPVQASIQYDLSGAPTTYKLFLPILMR